MYFIITPCETYQTTVLTEVEQQGMESGEYTIFKVIFDGSDEVVHLDWAELQDWIEQKKQEKRNNLNPLTSNLLSVILGLTQQKPNLNKTHQIYDNRNCTSTLRSFL
jgi:hypothetical protein